MSVYEIEITLQNDEGFQCSAKRRYIYESSDDPLSLGWYMGQEIADAILSIRNYLTHDDLKDIFKSIADSAEEEIAEIKEANDL